MSSNQNIADDLLAMLRNENEGGRSSQIELIGKKKLEKKSIEAFQKILFNLQDQRLQAQQAFLVKSSCLSYARSIRSM